MVSTRTKVASVEEMMALPTDEPWEIWEGELRKVPGAGGEASGLAGWILVLLTHFVRPRRLGWLTSSDGTYILRQDPLTVVVPDVGFVAWDRLPGRIPPKGYIPVPPDLAIEVRSPQERPGAINDKLVLYWAAGVPLIWWVDPDRHTVRVYRHGEFAAELGEGDTLDGEDILPGFTLPVSEIFE